MSNITASMPEPQSVSITPGSPSVSRTPEPVKTRTLCNICVVHQKSSSILRCNMHSLLCRLLIQRKK